MFGISTFRDHPLEYNHSTSPAVMPLSRLLPAHPSIVAVSKATC